MYEGGQDGACRARTVWTEFEETDKVVSALEERARSIRASAFGDRDEPKTVEKAMNPEKDPPPSDHIGAVMNRLAELRARVHRIDRSLEDADSVLRGLRP